MFVTLPLRFVTNATRRKLFLWVQSHNGLDMNPTEVCFYTRTPLVKSEQDYAHAKRRDIMI